MLEGPSLRVFSLCGRVFWVALFSTVKGQDSFFPLPTRRSVILNWPERIKTQPHDDGDNFLHFDSKGPCGMTVNNDIDVNPLKWNRLVSLIQQLLQFRSRYWVHSVKKFPLVPFNLAGFRQT